MKKKAQFTYYPQGERKKKNLLFLDLIRNHKSISRTELAKITGITVVTVSNYVNAYLEKGLVLEHGYEASSGGRKPELVKINSNWGYAVGVDARSDCVRAILTNLNMDVLAAESISGCEKEDISASVETILEKIFSSSKVDKTRVKKIGITLSASSDNAAADLEEIKTRIENKIKISTLTSTSAPCAAFGEKILNPNAKGAARVLYVYTELGEGILIEGDEFAEVDKRSEAYAYLRPWSRNLSIANEAKKIIKSGVGTKIVEVSGGLAENITLDMVIKAAEEKDEIAIDLLKTSGMNLSVRIAYLINLLKPEVVIIGGGIERALDKFLKPLQKSMKKFITERLPQETIVAPAVLKEEACVKGGAFLAIREAFIEA